jgi:antitoxin YefM
MNAFTLTYAKENLERVLQEAINHEEPIFIATDSGQTVVLLSLEEWSSLKETAFLAANPAMRQRLFEAVEDVKRGKNMVERQLID